MNKILSIIIPTYNMEKYLDKCLSSLIIEDKELMNLLEVLVIIDGAKDRSSEIAHTYQNLYPDTFRVIDKKNGNYGSCINRGIKETTGKYVKVLDADDYFDTTEFPVFLKALMDLDVDMVLTNCCHVDEDGTITGYFSLNDRVTPYKIINTKSLSIDNVMRRLQMHNITYKSKNLSDMNYIQTEGISYTDQEWNTIPMAMVDKCYFIPLNLYCYLLGREGQTMDTSVLKKKFHDMETMCLSLVQAFCSFKGNGYVSDFYKFKSLEQSKNLYRYTIVEHIFDYKELLRFDRKLKCICTEIYNLLDSSLIYECNYRPIRHWRMGNTYFLKVLFEDGWTIAKKHYSIAQVYGNFKGFYILRVIIFLRVKLALGRYFK